MNFKLTAVALIGLWAACVQAELLEARFVAILDGGHLVDGTIIVDDAVPLASGFGLGPTDGIERLEVTFYSPSGTPLFSQVNVEDGISSYFYLRAYFDTVNLEFPNMFFEVGQDTFTPGEILLQGNIGEEGVLVSVREASKGSFEYFFLDSTSSLKLPTASEYALIFREADDATWECLGFGSECIPGWDHVGVAAGPTVWESHPGYATGNWWEPEFEAFLPLMQESGVQAVHTPGSFKHDKMSMSTNAASESYSLDPAVARSIATYAESQNDASFLFLCASTLDIQCWRTTLDPAKQKGSEGAFTCVGLIEKGAEQAGVNDGQGFIPDSAEWISIAGVNIFPALSPHQLYWYTVGEEDESSRGTMLTSAPLQGVVVAVEQWTLIDPLGRRLGRIPGGGVVNEIPGAQIIADDEFAQYFVPSSSIGSYSLEIIGQGSDAISVVGDGTSGDNFSGMLEEGEMLVQSFAVGTVCAADCDDSGAVDFSDLVAMLSEFGTTGSSPGCDADASGTVDFSDLVATLSLFGPCPN